MSPRKRGPDQVIEEERYHEGMGEGPDPIVVRHSELADFRHCPLKWHIGWREGWHSPARESGGARELGTVWHSVLAIRYRYLQKCQETGAEPDEDAVLEAVGREIETAHSELRETLHWMYAGYVECYGWDSDLRILSVEQTLRVPFHDENNEPLVIRYVDPSGTEPPVWRPVLYSWTSDILAVSRTCRGIVVVDTKSTSQPMSDVDIDLSDQFGLYTVAWRRLGRKVVGQLVNQAKTKALKRPMTMEERFARVPSLRTPVELRNIELDAVDTIRAMYSEQNLRRPYSSPDPRSCGWKCDFKEPHLRLRRKANPMAELPAVMRAFGLEQGATHGQ